MDQNLQFDTATGELLLFEGDTFLEILRYDGDAATELPLNVPVVAEYDGGVLIDVKAKALPKAIRVGKPRLDIAVAAIGQHGYPPRDYEIRNTQAYAATLQADISLLAGNTHEVLVTPYAFECPRLAGLSLRYFDWTMFYDHANAVNPNHRHTHWMGVGGPRDAGTCGRAWLGGNKSWVYSGCSYGTIIHELGHNLGFDHAGTPGNEYGDRLSWMGNGDRREVFTAPHNDVFGIYGDRTIHVSATTQARSVILVDAQSHATVTPVGQAHFITADTTEGPIGIGFVAGMVRVYKQARPGSWIKTHLVDEAINVADYGDLRVTVGAQTRSGVEILMRRVDSSASPLPPSVWTPTPDEDGPVIDLSDIDGVWHSDATHQGLFIWKLPEGHEGDVLVAWLTWDRKGNPRFLYALCQTELDGRAFGGELLSTRRVDRFNTEMYSEGLMCAHKGIDGGLVVRFDTTTLGRGQMVLRRGSRGDGGGKWGWYAAEEMEHTGLLVSTNEPGPGQAVGTAAMYFVDHSQASFVRGNGQRWAYIDGPVTAFGQGNGFALRDIRHAQRLNAIGKVGVDTVGSVTVSDDLSSIRIPVDGVERTITFRPVFGF